MGYDYKVDYETLYIPLKDMKVSQKGPLVQYFDTVQKRIDYSNIGLGRAFPINLKIDIPMDKMNGSIKIEASFVQTLGRQVGFYFNIVDMDSGDIVMGNVKTPHFIRLCRFSNYLEWVLDLKEGSLPWAAVKYHLEQFKLYGTDLYGFLEGIYNQALGQARTAGDSFIKTKVTSANLGNVEKFTVEKYRVTLMKLERLQQHLSLLFNSDNKYFSSIMSDSLLTDTYLKSSVNNEKDYTSMVDFIAALGSIERKEYGHDVFEVDYGINYPVEERGDSRDVNVNNRMLYMSALPSYRSTMDYLHFGKKPSKSSLIALNFIDVLDIAGKNSVQGEKEYEDMYLMAEEGNYDDLKELTKRLGVEDVVKGSTLTAIKRGFKAQADRYSSEIYKNLERRTNMTGRKRPEYSPDYDYSHMTREDSYDFGQFGGLKGVKYDVEAYIYISKYVEKINRFIENID